MLIDITNVTGTDQVEVDINEDYSATVIRAINFKKLRRGKTKAKDKGVASDKYISAFSILGDSDFLFTVIDKLDNAIGQITITAEEGELIFGAGIDYSNPIVCNVIRSDVDYSQDNITSSQIRLEVEAVQSNSLQLGYRQEITGIPTFRYQFPLKRTLRRLSKTFSSEAFGDFGVSDQMFGTDPAYSYAIPIGLLQTESEAAQIEKYVSTQRATPFLMPGLCALNIFNGQDTEEVLISTFTTKRVNLARWSLTLGVVTNV